MPYEEVSVSPDGLSRVFWGDDDNLWAEGIAYSPAGEKVVRRALVIPEGSTQPVTRNKPAQRQAGEVGLAMVGGSPLYVMPTGHPRDAFRAAQLRAVSRGLRPGIPAPVPEWQQELQASGRELMRARAAEERRLLESFAHVGEPGYEPPPPAKGDESKRGTLADHDTAEAVKFDANEQVDRALRAGDQVSRGVQPHWASPR